MFVYKNKMLHECLRAFILSNYLRMPTPPTRQHPATWSSPPTPHRQIQRMVVDFDNAMWRAARVVFLIMELKGCVFHFMQAKRYQGSNRAKN